MAAKGGSAHATSEMSGDELGKISSLDRVGKSSLPERSVKALPVDCAVGKTLPAERGTAKTSPADRGARRAGLRQLSCGEQPPHLSLCDSSASSTSSASSPPSSPASPVHPSDSIWRDARISVGVKHQVKVLPDWRSATCVEERGDQLVAMDSDAAVADVIAAEKKAAEAWHAFKAEVHGSTSGAGACPAPAELKQQEANGKRMRALTPKAEALLQMAKCARQEVRQHRPPSRPHGASSSSSHAPPTSTGASAEGAGKAGRGKAHEKTVRPAAAGAAGAAAVSEQGGSSEDGLAAAPAAPAAAGQKRAPQKKKRGAAAGEEPPRPRSRARADALACHLDHESPLALLALACQPVVLPPLGKTTPEHEEMLWHVVATPLMMREFSKHVAATYAAAANGAPFGVPLGVPPSAPHPSAAPEMPCPDPEMSSPASSPEMASPEEASLGTQPLEGTPTAAPKAEVAAEATAPRAPTPCAEFF